MSNKINENLLFPVFTKNINALIEKECAGNKKIFAQSIAVHYDSVRRWCNGETLPDGGNLIVMQTKYNISIDWLLTGKDSGELLICEWLPETQKACLQVKKIIESKDKTTALALRMNIQAFDQAIDLFDENHCLKTDVEDLKKSVKQLLKKNSLGASTGID